MKKKSELFQPEKSSLKKQKRWQNYDLDSLPELSAEQLADFRKVSRETFISLRPTKIHKLGRPVKAESEKEKQISIRFKPAMLRKIKDKAKRTGYSSYQRYIKAVLEKSVG